MAKALKLFQNADEKIAQGKQAELNDDIDLAVKCYEEATGAGYPSEYAFNRLMVIYRRQKKYKDELKVINNGIQLFTQVNKRQLEENISRKKNKKEIEKLSQAFMKSSGLVDRKGKDVHVPQPVEKWMKRKLVVEKRLRKK